jgi:hypothetical protein
LRLRSAGTTFRAVAVPDAEKVERIKWINEILHRATAKVWVLQTKTHEDMG